MTCEQPKNPELKPKCGFNAEMLLNANDEDLKPLVDKMEGRGEMADKEGLSFSAKVFIAQNEGISYEDGEIQFVSEEWKKLRLNVKADTKEVKYYSHGSSLMIDSSDLDGDKWHLELTSKDGGKTFNVKKEKVAEVKANKEITLLNNVGPDFFHLKDFADRFDTLYENFDNLRYDEKLVVQTQMKEYVKRETGKNINITTLTTGYNKNGQEAFIVNDRFTITRGTN